MKMIRKQVYIEPEQERKLKRLAKRLGVTEAELIRQAIDTLPQVEAESQAASRETLRVAGPSPSYIIPRSRADIYRDYPRHLDKEAWEEALAFMKERARTLPRSTGGRDWTRDELYDERPKYLSH